MLRTTVAVPDFAPLIRGLEDDIAVASTTAMRGATETLKSTLRDQVRSVGMSSRMANTWRAVTYPGSRSSLTPAGYAWSNAPDIVDAFSDEKTISPLGGKNFLWIPTKNVPRKAGRGGRKQMTPFEVEVSFDQDLIIRKWKGGRSLAFVSVARARTKRGGYRKVTKGRQAQGHDAELVLMFVLVPNVRTIKRFDLDDAAAHAADDYVERFNSAAR